MELQRNSIVDRKSAGHMTHWVRAQGKQVRFLYMVQVVMPNGYEAPLGKGFEYPRNSVRLWVPLGARKGQYGSAADDGGVTTVCKTVPSG